MKKILLFILLLTFPIMAQRVTLTQYNWGEDVEYYYLFSTIDSGITTNAPEINLNQFDASLDTYKAGYLLNIDTLTENDEIIKVEMHGNYSNGTFQVVDTLLAADTINAAHSGYTNVKGEFDLNVADNVFPIYKPVITITSASGNTCTVKLSLYFYKKD